MENIKRFSHIITCLSKANEVLNLEMNANKCIMSLHTVNSMLSTYIHFTLHHDFFFNYDPSLNRNQKVQLQSKAFLSVFRYLSNIKELRMYIPEKPGNDDEMDESNTNMFIIECISKKDLKKTTKLRYLQVDPLIARHEASNYPVQICYDAKRMNQCLTNFSNSISEISFVLEQQEKSNNISQEGFVDKQIRIKNYVNQETTDMQNVLITQLTINFSQFKSWRCDIEAPSVLGSPDRVLNTSTRLGAVNSSSRSSNRSRLTTDLQVHFQPQLEMTFNLKDFKSFVTFCENTNQLLTIFMDNQGKPIIFRSNTENSSSDIEAVCVLATLLNDGSSQKSSQTNTSSADLPNSNRFSFKKQEPLSERERSSTSTFHPFRSATSPQASLNSEEMNLNQSVKSSGNGSIFSTRSSKRGRYDEEDDNTDDDKVEEDEAFSQISKRSKTFDDDL